MIAELGTEASRVGLTVLGSSRTTHVRSALVAQHWVAMVVVDLFVKWDQIVAGYDR